MSDEEVNKYRLTSIDDLTVLPLPRKCKFYYLVVNHQFTPPATAL